MQHKILLQCPWARIPSNSEERRFCLILIATPFYSCPPFASQRMGLRWITDDDPPSPFLFVSSSKSIIPSNSPLVNTPFSIIHWGSLPSFNSLGTMKIACRSFTRSVKENLAHLNPDSNRVFPLKSFLPSINIPINYPFLSS